ncbi:hypothetical protein [Chitinophaga rhizophila]|uniref:Uncharacterized protein n=1 Tax=Chitinophaga rhizophila TaxID=2866212 RepID=A0ABS7GIA7_9BACT|nr:hypothetical protein [Chitinophaga rhizophila]MBW8687061.1 hypothetical protein [Chitinophaga rhizophila]
MILLALKALQVDNLPASAILIKIIDNFVSNGKLVSLLRAKVGLDRLLFPGINIPFHTACRTAVIQLYNCLIAYMKQDGFNLVVTITAGQAKRVGEE